MRRSVVVVVLAALLVCPLVLAQHDEHEPATVIDGAAHPELVPDSAAYRLFLMATAESPDATPERKIQQKEKLAAIELTDDELNVVTDILATFKAECEKRINQYNASVVVANEIGIAPNLKGFLEDQDFLVQVTRDILRSALMPDSMARFDAHVQHEKRHMVVAKDVQ